MNRLSRLLKRRQETGEKLLSMFVTAGFPRLDSAPEVVPALEAAGVDFVEIGMPFSDPIADGPTIQHASQVALTNGMTLRRLLEQIRAIRRKSDLPMILMGYLNPMVKYGFERFVADAEAAGVDGLIVPDLTPDVWPFFAPAFKERAIGVNFLISPNTPEARIKKVDECTHDFIYCVSVTGVTGARQGVPSGLSAFLTKIQERVNHPYLVGFGISNPEDAKEIARYCHGVIVGSALIKLMSERQDDPRMLEVVGNFAQGLKNALKGV